MSEDVRLDNTVIRWPKYIPQPENYFLLLAEAALEEARHWQQFYPQQNFNIDLYVRFHKYENGDHTMYAYDGIKANWHENMVPPGRDCVHCGRAIFVMVEGERDE